MDKVRAEQRLEAAMGGQGESLLQAGLSAAENTGLRGSYSWVVGMRGSRRQLELALVLDQSWAWWLLAGSIS